MWQGLYEELKDENFTVVAVGLESRGADSARQWIELAKPTYPCLIDTRHVVAAAYNMVNVPQAVWIDETGHIVRPTETAGTTDGFRKMDTTTFQMPADELAQAQKARGIYLDAIRDWVRHGAQSTFVVPSATLQATTPAYSDSQAQANAMLQLGQWLVRHDKAAAGFALLRRASDLHPDSWSIWRQTADLEEIGKSGGPGFWARVQALGERKYYPKPNIAGMPD